MDEEQPFGFGMTSPAIYRVVVLGRLDKGWEVWFNGTENQIEENQSGKPHTTLTCRVRDQAELLGVLNRLNSLNLPLLQVDMIDKNPKVKR